MSTAPQPLPGGTSRRRRRKKGGGGGGYSSASDSDCAGAPVAAPAPLHHGIDLAVFADDAAREANLELQAAGVVGVHLPSTAGRTAATAAAVVEECVNLLAAEQSPGRKSSALLSALSLALGWAGPAVTPTTALRLLEVVPPLAPDTAALSSLYTFFRLCFPKKNRAVAARALDVILFSADLTRFFYSFPAPVRTGAVKVVTQMLEHLPLVTFQATEPRKEAFASFTSYSEKVGSVLLHLHTTALAGLSSADPVPFLLLLQNTSTATPYPQLPSTARFLVSTVFRALEVLLFNAGEKGIVLGCLQVLTAVSAGKAPFKEFTMWMEGAGGPVLDKTVALAAHPTYSVYRNEATRFWTGVARNYPGTAASQERWGPVLGGVSQLLDAPDQMSKLTGIAFLSSASEGWGEKSTPGAGEELPVLDFGCFGVSRLPPGAVTARIARGLERKPLGAEVKEQQEVARDYEGGALARCGPEEVVRIVLQLLLPLLSDDIAAVRGHAAGVLANIPPSVLPASCTDTVFSSLLLLSSSDPNNTVRGTAARVLGVWLTFPHIIGDSAKLEAASSSLFALFALDQQLLHQKAGWAVAGICEQLTKGEVGTEAVREISGRAVEVCLGVVRGYANGKLPWNVVRALGNGGRVCSRELSEAFAVCSGLLDDKNVKVRWNTAYAAAQLFRNEQLRTRLASGTSSESEQSNLITLLSKLCLVLHTEINFKVRIQSCWALSALIRFPRAPETLHILLSGVLQALRHTNTADVDFEQYKYREVLFVSLKGVLLHAVRSALNVAAGGGAEGKEMIAALVDHCAPVSEVLRSMLGPENPRELDGDEDETAVPTSPQMSVPSGLLDDVLLPQHRATQERFDLHDSRWDPLRPDITAMIDSLKSVAAGGCGGSVLHVPRSDMAEGESDMSNTELNETLKNFASLFSS